MLRILSLLLVLAAQSFSARRDLLLENLAFRQQLTVLKRGHPQPRFAPLTGCLGDIAAVLVRIETGVDSRPAGNRGAMAPCRIQGVLELALAVSNSRRQKGYQRGTPRAHLPHGGREPNLGALRAFMEN